jgi:hypothetical protein
MLQVISLPRDGQAYAIFGMILRDCSATDTRHTAPGMAISRDRSLEPVYGKSTQQKEFCMSQETLERQNNYSNLTKRLRLVFDSRETYVARGSVSEEFLEFRYM